MDNIIQDAKEIPIFPGYLITINGTIFNKKTKRIIKTPTVNNCGYRIALLRRNNKRFAKSLHRLIAITYLGLSEHSKMTVDHIDRNKDNNNLENLRVVSFAENMKNKGSRKETSNIFCRYSRSDSRNIMGYNVIFSRNNVKTHYKIFKTFEEAKIVRDLFLLQDV